MTHTSIAELVKEKIDSDEFLSTLEIEQEILSYVNSDRFNFYPLSTLEIEQEILSYVNSDRFNFYHPSTL